MLQCITCCVAVVCAGAPRVVHSQIKLPARLVIKPMLPVKTSTFKITIDTNKPPVNLNELFPGMTFNVIMTEGHSCLKITLLHAVFKTCVYLRNNAIFTLFLRVFVWAYCRSAE